MFYCILFYSHNPRAGQNERSRRSERRGKLAQCETITMNWVIHYLIEKLSLYLTVNVICHMQRAQEGRLDLKPHNGFWKYSTITFKIPTLMLHLLPYWHQPLLDDIPTDGQGFLVCFLVPCLFVHHLTGYFWGSKI